MATRTTGEPRAAPLAVGDKPDLSKVEIEQHFTQPPARYCATEAKPHQEDGGARHRPALDLCGNIWRRSRTGLTAPRRSGAASGDRGRIVTAFLESFFSRYVEYGFHRPSRGTARPHLGRRDRLQAGAARLLARFHHRDRGDQGSPRLRGAGRAQRAPRRPHLPAPARWRRPTPLPDLRHGHAIAQARKSSAPSSAARTIPSASTPCSSPMRRRASPPRPRPAMACSAPIPKAAKSSSQSGRFGPYVQLGEGKEPKAQLAAEGVGGERASPDAGQGAAACSNCRARWACIPKPVCRSARPWPLRAVPAAYGKYAKPAEVEEVFTVGLNRAVDLIAQKAAGGGRGGRGASQAAIKSFEHDGGPITVRAGRYGPQCDQGKVNATIPKDTKPEDVTLEQAIALLAARAEGDGPQGEEGAGQEGGAEEKRLPRPRPKPPPRRPPPPRRRRQRRSRTPRTCRSSGTPLASADGARDEPEPVVERDLAHQRLAIPFSRRA